MTTVSHAINKKKKNFDAWFEAMERAQALAKKRAQNAVYEAAGSLADLKTGNRLKSTRKRKPPGKYGITANTNPVTRSSSKVNFLACSGHAQMLVLGMPKCLYWACPNPCSGHAHYMNIPNPYLYRSCRMRPHRRNERSSCRNERNQTSACAKRRSSLNCLLSEPN